MNSYYATTPILDLRVSCKTATGGVNTGTFLPSNHSTITEFDKLSEEAPKRRLQIMMDKDPIRVNRIGTNVRLTSEIDDGHVLIKCAANITVLAITIAQYNVTSVKYISEIIVHSRSTI